MDSARLRDHLKKAESDLIAAVARADRQRALVERLKANNNDARYEIDDLRTQQNLVKTLERHRDMLREQLNGLL